jgi:RNA-directed DNA polymerase
MGAERRGRLIRACSHEQPGRWPGRRRVGRSDPKDKPFAIPKQLVWEAYRRVAANKGAPGLDGQSVAAFEADLRNNLYKIWNRMSSGTYFPPPVRAVEIPKPHGGGTRVLGVPTVADRVAQTVAALALEPRMESIFHPDSYGYRPRRSALDALARCRQRCQKRNWVVDLDVQKFFDSVDHDLMVKAVQANVTPAQRWVVLYVKRWLTAPLALPDGTLQARERGTPQGSAVSPVLANLFLHYAFDSWLAREFPAVEFERYADDAVVHCVTERQALQVRNALAARMEEVGLRLHPAKTRIVYCKDDNRRGSYEHTSFTFLGYQFRARSVRSKRGMLFTAFTPAISPQALKKISREVRSWRIHTRTRHGLHDLAGRINPVVRGWMNYYGRFTPAALHPLLKRINGYLVRWARRKYRRLAPFKRAYRWWNNLVARNRHLFAHWQWTGTFAWIR